MADDGTKKTLDGPGDYRFGELNPMFRGVDKPYYDTKNDPYSIVKQTIIKSLTPNVLENVGPFKAVVLRVEPKYAGPTADPNSKNTAPAANEPDLVRIACRIPEMEASLPIPDQFGDVEGPHHSIIDLYTVFTAQSDSVPEPAPGELVWVDFVDKQSLVGGIYLRPIVEKESLISSIAGKVSGLGSFGQQPCNQYSASPSAGDPQPTQRSNVVQSGLPRSSRKLEPMGENLVIRGQNLPPSEKVIEKWMSGVNAAGMKGSKNYFSKFESNRNHHAIIHIPGTTNLAEPVEVAYFIHGAGSWNKQTLFTTLPKSTKTLGDQGRNIITVFVENRPASGKVKYWSDPGGGSFTLFHREILSTIPRVFNLPSFNAGYISVTAHSMGGRTISRAADELAPVSKLTLADVVGNENLFENLKTHLESRQTPLQLNILGFRANRPKKTGPENLAKRNVWEWARGQTGAQFVPNAPGEYNPGPGARSIKLPNGTIITKENIQGANHSKYGIIALEYINPHVRSGPETIPTTVETPADFGEWAYGRDGEFVGWYDTGGQLHLGVPEGMSPPDRKKDPPPIEGAPQSSTKNSTTQKCADAPTIDSKLQEVSEKLAQAAASENTDPVLIEQLQAEQASLQERQSECADNAATCAGVLNKYCSLVEPPVANKESRVRLKSFGALTRTAKGSNGQPLAVPVATIPGKRQQFLHRLAAKRFEALNNAWTSETGQPPFQLSSGLRKPFLNHDPVAYEAFCLREYGSLRKCKNNKALYSAHETGLALDFGNNGLEPRSKTQERQVTTQAHKWLTDNAHKFGITPYNREAWHWEVNMPLESWETGEEWIQGDNFAVRVIGQGRSGRQSKQGGPTTTQIAGQPGASCGGISTVGQTNRAAVSAAGPVNTNGDFVPGNYAPPNPNGLFPPIKPVIKGDKSLVDLYGAPPSRDNIVRYNFQNAQAHGIKGIKVHKAVAVSLEMVDKEINALKQNHPDVAAYEFWGQYALKGGGGFYPKCKRNSKFVKGTVPPNCPSGISNHTFGNAIDINPAKNPYNHSGPKKGMLETDIPALIVGAFKRYGWVWGGDWKSPDSMHFEFRGDPRELSNFNFEAPPAPEETDSTEGEVQGPTPPSGDV